MSDPASCNDYALGLALSGGGFRGVAHIGVLRTLVRRGLRPDFVAGTSAGSLIGALYASGKTVDEIESVAHQISWPALLRSQGVREFSRKYLPRTFAKLAPALAASCATPYFLHRVRIGANAYTDGGWACVLPAGVCRQLCRTVIGSDVWFRAAVARRLGLSVDGRWGEAAYSKHYLEALRQCDLAIHPCIPSVGMIPSRVGIDRLIKSGEAGAEQGLETSPRFVTSR